MDLANYVIWSNEHGLWVASDGHGYARLFHLAGRFTREEMELRLRYFEHPLLEDGAPREIALEVALTIEPSNEVDDELVPLDHCPLVH